MTDVDEHGRPEPPLAADETATLLGFLEYEARVAAAIAAGGHLVSDEHAPMWWTLADAEGNEADIATTMGRD